MLDIASKANNSITIDFVSTPGGSCRPTCVFNSSDLKLFMFANVVTPHYKMRVAYQFVCKVYVCIGVNSIKY